MTALDFTCAKCGASRTIDFEIDAPDIEFGGFMLSCDCGGMMETPRDIITGRRINGQLVMALRKATEGELRDLRDLTESFMRDPSLKAVDVADRLAATGTETGRAIGDWVRANESWFALLGLLLSVLSFIDQRLSGPDVEIHIDKIVNEITVQVPQDRNSYPRNSPCPCGSGAKWKRCHGAPEGTLGARDGR